MNKPMTKKAWLEYIEKTWDASQEEARTWVGLTNKERSELWWSTDMGGMPEHDYGKAIEAKLKELNT